MEPPEEIASDPYALIEFFDPRNVGLKSLIESFRLKNVELRQVRLLGLSKTAIAMLCQEDGIRQVHGERRDLVSNAIFACLLGGGTF